MNTFDHIPEPPDLTNQLTVLGKKPVFSGPYSCVYRGKIRQSGQIVAIKVLNALEGKALHTMRRKLARERGVWAALEHPNVLPLWGYAEDEELFEPFGALISPWLQSGDAANFLQKHSLSLTTEKRTNLWKGVVAGINYLHSHTPLLVHGDLKPKNILIDGDGHPRICDFGLVRIYLEHGLRSGMTTTTAHTGTERYLAYELVIAGEDAIPTTESDIYAVGCIGLEFIFSQNPHSSRKNGFGGVIFADIKGGTPPAKRPTNLPRSLEPMWNALERCWDRFPSNRPSAASLLAWLDGEVARQLGQVLSPELVTLPSSETDCPSPKKDDSNVPTEQSGVVKRRFLESDANLLDAHSLFPTLDEETKVDVCGIISSPNVATPAPSGELDYFVNKGLPLSFSPISPFWEKSISIASYLHLNTRIPAPFFFFEMGKNRLVFRCSGRSHFKRLFLIRLIGKNSN